MLEKIKDELKIFFDSNSSHDFDHTMRVYNMSIHIWEIEWADLEILKIAALMHDIGRKKQHETKWKICHAEHWTLLAKNILEKLEMEKHKIDAILHCISTHRFRKWNQPESLEAKVLFDADKLDSIWAVGIWRAFMYANEVWARIHNDETTDILDTQEHSPEDTAYREYIVKLQKVKDKMFTKVWKTFANERHKTMESFFMDLNKEVRWTNKLN